MNMKKTIAAVAASAMAVSAMAVTVSADTTLSYNLVATHKVPGVASVTLQATVNGKATSLTFTDLKNMIKIKTMTLRITDEGDASVNKVYTYATGDDQLNYNKNFKDGTFDFTDELNNVENPKIQIVVTGETNYSDLKSVNTAIDNKDVAITPTGATATPTIVTNYTGATDTVYKLPFKTGPDGNENIAFWLQNMNCRNDDNPYRNVLPTINDALANFDSATFVFTTATQPVAWAVDRDHTGTNPDGTKTTVIDYGGLKYGEKNSWSQPCLGYNEALAAAHGDPDRVQAIYAEDWYGDKSYMSFSQHLYNGTGDYYGVGQGWLGYDGEPLGIAWAGNNLFGGALVINENLTMTLSDVDYFQWTNTTLSFDWEAIMDGAMTSNAYATYVQSIKLATSVNWYWDKMDVVLVEGEGDDAAADAGTESDEETLDETDVDDTMDEELTEDETEEEETPADETEEAEETPVQDNPGTGNAPVALAVIPVALAAAAVVAKKRG